MARKDRRRRNDGAESAVGTFLIKAGSKLLFGVFIVLAFLTLAQCTVKQPEAPSWSTQFVVPVVNRTYTMEELIRRMDQEGLEINDSGDVVFSVTEDLDTIGLNDDDFSTDDLNYSFGENLGAVGIEAPVVSPVTVALSEIGNIGVTLPGDSVLVLDTTFTVESTMPPISSFTSATISQGQVVVVLGNELDLTLDNIVVDLIDSQTRQVLSSGSHAAQVPSGTQVQIALVLDGATIPSSMSIMAAYHTPTDTIRNASARFISSSFEFSETLTAVAAVAQIPALSRVDSTVVALAESDRIDSALLATGTLQLNVANATNLDASVTVEVPDFSQFGQPLTSVSQVPARGAVNVSLDLAGCALVPTFSVLPQTITVIASAEMPGSGLTQVAINQTDSFHVSAQLGNLKFASVTGLFQAVSATFDGISEEIDIPNGLEDVELAKAIVTLEVENAIDLPGEINIVLSGDNGKQTVFTGDIAPRGLASSVSTTVVNNAVADFLAPLPSRIDASGAVTFGDGAYQGTITRDDFVCGRVTLHAPLEMVINPSRVETEIENEEIDQEDIETITEHFIEGRFVYRLTSHLPIGAHVNLFLSGDSATLFTDPALRFDSLYMTAAPIGPGGIVVDTAQTTDQEIYLDSADIKILENPVLYIGHEILLEGSNGQVVKLTADDYMTITGRIEVEYLFDGKF